MNKLSNLIVKVISCTYSTVYINWESKELKVSGKLINF